MELYKDTGMPASSMDIESKQEITFEQRKDLMHFNTHKHWHCFYDPKTKKLYNEYCRLIDEDAESYLQGIGLLSTDGEQIEYFEQ